MMNRRSRNNNRGASNAPRRGGNGGGGGNGLSRSHVFDSNGPEVRIRGTAFQVHEKYMALAKDAFSVGDRILAENYLQHAEHYQRVINGWMEADAPALPADGVVEPAAEAYASDVPQPVQRSAPRPPERSGGDQPHRSGPRPQYLPRSAAPASSAPRREADLGLPPSILGIKPAAASAATPSDAASRPAVQNDELAGA
jgi:hypothetical protein